MENAWACEAYGHIKTAMVLMSMRHIEMPPEAAIRFQRAMLAQITSELHDAEAIFRHALGIGVPTE